MPTSDDLLERDFGEDWVEELEATVARLIEQALAKGKR